MKHSYFIAIATGKVIHDGVEVTATSELIARALVQKRIDVGEFYRESVDLSPDPDKPLIIEFPPGSEQRIAMVVDNGIVQ